MDNASATPVDKGVLKAMEEVNLEHYTNPSGLHKQSVEARRILENARKDIAKELFAHADEIIFTASGSESDALAIEGTINFIANKYSEVGLPNIPHIVTTNIEHSAVIETCKMLERTGRAEVTYVGVEANGIVDQKNIKEAIKENTVLVSVMYANNEIGTIQPIKEIAKVVRGARKIGKQSRPTPNPSPNFSNLERGKMQSIASRISPLAIHEVNGEGAGGEAAKAGNSFFPFFHVDACQAMNYLETGNMDALGVDLLSFNGAKIYGPKGMGVLYKRRSVELVPVINGGGQEFHLRAGTENVAGAVGMALALAKTNKIKEKESERLRKLQQEFFTGIKDVENKTGYKIEINGDLENRIPNNVNISVAGISNELLVIELDANGVAVSNKSACKTDEEESSHVINAIRKVSGSKFTDESIRFSIGRDTKAGDVKKVLQILTKILEKYNKWK